MARGLSFFNQNDDDDINIVIHRKIIEFPSFIDKKVKILEDKEKWSIILLSNSLPIEKCKKILIKKEATESVLGDKEIISQLIHKIKIFRLTTSIYKSSSLFSFFGLQSPYVQYPSSLRIGFTVIDKQLENMENEFFIEIGGGETHHGCNWIDTKIENVPSFDEDVFSSKEEENKFLQEFQTRRLSWSQVNSEFNNFVQN